MQLLRGIPVTLIKLTESTSADDFGVPEYTETEITVSDVLVSPTSDDEILDTVNLYGKEAVYTLSIPKDDENDWENTFVEFFGSRWRTIGKPIEYIGALTPLRWNKKVRVESCRTPDSSTSS